MIKIDVLEKKPITTINGVDRVDLTVSSIAPPNQIDFGIANYILCPANFEMRPDLLSSFYMGNTQYLGTLLKINCIGNPFSVVQGDIFMIPTLTMASSMLKDNQLDTGASDRANFRKNLSDRISKVSADRQNYLSARGVSAAALLPPNVTAPNDQQFVVKDGKLIFGSSIGNCRTNVAENKSKATIKARLIQKNIFNS